MNADEIVIFVILFSGVIFDMLHKDRHPPDSYHMIRGEFIPAGQPQARQRPFYEDKIRSGRVLLEKIMNQIWNRSRTDPPERFWPQAARWDVIVMAYCVAVRVGLLLLAQPEEIIVVWQACGMVLDIGLLQL